MRLGLGHAAFHELAEAFGETIRRLARDLFAVVVEGRFGRTGRKKRQWPPALWQIFQRDDVLRGVEVGVEIVNAKLVEVAEHHVARTVGHEARPVVEGLAVVALEVGAALFHFDEYDRFPDVVGKRRAAAVFLVFADTELGRAANIERASLAEGLEKPVEEDLCLTLLIARDVFPAPLDKISKFFPIRHGAEIKRAPCSWRVRKFF